MKRALGALWVMVVVLSSLALSAQAATSTCTQGDVERLAQGGIQFGSRALGGQPSGAPGVSDTAGFSCQFRSV